MSEVRKRLDIVDAQVHLFHGLTPEACLSAMDALGIRSVLVDEAWTNTPPVQPYQVLDNNILRPLADGGRMASMRYPERFKYLMRANHLDPDVETVVRLAAGDPHCLALRAWVEPEWAEDFAGGGYRRLFAAATEFGMPTFVFTAGHNDRFAQYLTEFTEGIFILDHLGFARTAPAWEEVLRLSEHPNVSLKWCHEHSAFAAGEHPFPVLQAELRRALDVYGAERVMWASDATTLARHGLTWADTLIYLRDTGLLTREERAWVLGRSVRSTLRWPSPPAISC
ncbi:amidohydrolase family protein [Amycolatopsis pithecellobii]|uniref:Amidohydrolase family protein n=1 Tax=Amycolatopsis pithecellobii TaxID=664692 RepID=A0A6N7YRK4_9PSEU|nr:amidohydrolase family protein [Amycolatopsis pithecellobii]MTD55655.1 amidohydrolase family protein [Amycolatopsis pithecellobii]